ncbi:hypothetical protein QL285_003085 [Trifolium repens]|nr:hypothetical protein QL285_003085 [Trifolium repens]
MEIYSGVINENGEVLSGQYNLTMRPNLTWNLVSVCQLCDSGYSVMFSSTHCYVKDPHSGTLVGKGHRSRDVLDELRIPSTSMPTSSRTMTAFSLPYFVFSGTLFFPINRLLSFSPTNTTVEGNTTLSRYLLYRPTSISYSVNKSAVLSEKDELIEACLKTNYFGSCYLSELPTREEDSKVTLN